MSFGGFRGRPPRGGPRGAFQGRGRGEMRGGAVYSPEGKVPPPDQLVRNHEDQIQKIPLDSIPIDQFPFRPGYGVKGKPVILWANYIQMMPDENLVLYRYDLDVIPSVTGRKRTQVIRLLLGAPELAPFEGTLASDFKSTLFVRDRLSDTEDETVIQIQYRDELEDEAREDATQYNIRLLYTNTLRVADLIEYLTSTNLTTYDDKLPMVQAFNVLLNHYSRTSANLSTVGANRTFPIGPPWEQTPLQNGLSIIRGFFSSVRLAACRILVNVNVSHAVFYDTGRLTDLIRQYQYANGRDPMTLNIFLKGLRGRTLHLPQRRNRSGELIIKPKFICGLARSGDGTEVPSERRPRIGSFGAGSKNVQFWLEPRKAPKGISTASGEKKGKNKGEPAASPAGPGRWVSVYDYFVETYNIRDSDPNLPVVNIGTRQRPTYLLAQTFEILPGQTHNGKLTPTQTQTMLSFASRRPVQNAGSIIAHGIDTVGLNPQKNPLLARLGISTANQLITVEGRVLDPPNITYRGYTIPPTSGSWNMVRRKFNSSGQMLYKWSYLFISTPGVPDSFPDPDSLNRVIHMLKDVLIDTGVYVEKPLGGRRLVVHGIDDPRLDETLKNAANSLDLLYIILPTKDHPLYPKIKRLCDVQYGLQTICSVGSRLSSERRQDQYLRNIALKFNLKRGGTNHAVDNLRFSLLNEDKTMVVGLDVTHPTGSPGITANAPSVAGMVASLDKHVGQWPATLQIQSAGRKEEVDNLDTMLKRHLGLWRTVGKHTSYPENILIYRDGVSEGQYQKVLTEELPLVRKACDGIYPPQDKKRGLPRVTIIIVNKRHHTRFFPTDSGMADRNGNTQPGTVVDRGVTEPYAFSFFLQPHAAIQGTAKTAFYFVILDEIFSKRYESRLPPNFYNVAEVVQDLTLNLSYLLGRATKSVRVCCAARYADIACDRARCYLSRFYEPAQSETSSDTGNAPDRLEEMKRDIEVHPKLKNTMFYI